MKYQDGISSFLAYLRDCESDDRISREEELIKENETQDLLHILELNSKLTFSEKGNIAKQLADIRQKRRIAKDTNSVTYLICEWISSHTDAIKSLEKLLGEVRKAEKKTENRFYTPRTDAGKLI